MKVYELISELAEMPGGAEVFCSSALKIDNLTSKDIIDYNDGKAVFDITERLNEAELIDGSVYLNF